MLTFPHDRRAAVTKEQKRTVRRALRLYGCGSALACPGKEGQDARAWHRVIGATLDYYAAVDPACETLLRLRYLGGMPEDKVIPRLHIGRTTYYHKELEVLSTAAIYAAAEGLM